ncbi:hypothetical protein SDC9_78047 [bioreactor metagenome]|uniref:Uncharacterized protein n=1 Tax=bioreactor metagenome TaxID=1076179 RepID=A0A644YSC9_9ZZZZ
MGGDDVALRVVRRVLDGAEILHLHIVRHHHKASGMLAGGAPNAHAAQSQTVFLRPSRSCAVLFQILFHHAISGLLRQSADGARAEHLGFAEHLDGMTVSFGLILAGEIQVDIRDLTAAKAKKCLEGDVEPVLHVLLTAHRTQLVRHVRTAAVGPILNELHVLALGAAIVGRQGVDLRDAGHIGNQ